MCERGAETWQNDRYLYIQHWAGHAVDDAHFFRAIKSYWRLYTLTSLYFISGRKFCALPDRAMRSPNDDDDAGAEPRSKCMN